eukprot:TRINITY_DN62152_c0_g1_i1.p1 TRINITY_DN62152_c0_g1~~TRINITY_DN62152_c0_g1_i1.p1  ORF type:complete len:457 (-),score=54.96 TRINITY_DN62152_c0_g1_i1:141-1511(-)
MYSPYPIYDRSGVDDDVDLSPIVDQTTCVTKDVEIKPSKPTNMNTSLQMKATLVIGSLGLALLASLLVLVAVGSAFPAIVSPGLLALTFGLRHAVDADHIAAIDNVTRKLVQDGQQPLTVGLFFALGHSTVVVIMCIVVAWTSGYAAERIPDFARIVGLWGASFSSCVLLIFALFNGLTAVRLFRKWRQVRKASATANSAVSTAHEHDDGEGYHTHVIAVVADENITIEGPGCLTTSPCCRFIFASINRPWKLYPVGFLFGLGFDTATEVSLLAVTAAVGASDADLPWVVTLVLPLLFTCGMSFIDTLDGIFMLWAYGWASLDAALQLWFNFSLTAISSFIALAIACVQVLGILQEELQLSGPVWIPVIAIGENSEYVGTFIIGVFVLSLAAASLYAKIYLCRDPTAVASQAVTGGTTSEGQQADQLISACEEQGAVQASNADRSDHDATEDWLSL